MKPKILYIGEKKQSRTPSSAVWSTLSGPNISHQKYEWRFYVLFRISVFLRQTFCFLTNRSFWSLDIAIHIRSLHLIHKFTYSAKTPDLYKLHLLTGLNWISAAKFSFCTILILWVFFSLGVFLSDPSPIIGNACQWLTDWLTDSVTFSKLDWCNSGMWRWQLKTC